VDGVRPEHDAFVAEKLSGLTLEERRHLLELLSKLDRSLG